MIIVSLLANIWPMVNIYLYQENVFRISPLSSKIIVPFRSQTGLRTSEKVFKSNASQFCEMFSNGWLPHRRSHIERLWENSAFDNIEKIKPWFGGTWNKTSQNYHSDYDDLVIENVSGRNGFKSSMSRSFVSTVMLMRIFKCWWPNLETTWGQK